MRLDKFLKLWPQLPHFKKEMVTPIFLHSRVDQPIKYMSGYGQTINVVFTF